METRYAQRMDLYCLYMRTGRNVLNEGFDILRVDWMDRAVGVLLLRRG